MVRVHSRLPDSVGRTSTQRKRSVLFSWRYEESTEIRPLESITLCVGIVHRWSGLDSSTRRPAPSGCLHGLPCRGQRISSPSTPPTITQARGCLARDSFLSKKVSKRDLLAGRAFVSGHPRYLDPAKLPNKAVSTGTPLASTRALAVLWTFSPPPRNRGIKSAGMAPNPSMPAA